MMFNNLELKQKIVALQSALDALNKSQAVIEFDLNGIILDANKNFLNVTGYNLDEIKGQHHSMFVEPEYKISKEYEQFWVNLKEGIYQQAEYRRFGKNGKEIWIQASYNPIFKDNKPFKIVKYATDITQEKLQNADYLGQINAIHKSKAVITFDLEGNILDANDNFLKTMGYSHEEIKGKHHSMFVESEYRNSNEYKQFWAELKQGIYHSGEFKRVNKSGKKIWLQACYNPILNLNGKPFKIVKYASDITKQMKNQRIKDIVDQNLNKLSSAINQSKNANNLAIQTSSNIQAVAAAAEEMSASIKDISSNIGKSKDRVEEMFNQIDTTNKTTQQLAVTSKSMSNIVDLIVNIANNINLLALNATIEAARAGEAGKGFAVVASEVKNLASQTTKATEQITNQINEMQNMSSNVGELLEGTKSSIEAVRQFTTIVATSIEEQTAVTSEISQNIQNASNSVNHISGNVNEVTNAIQISYDAINQVENASLD
ncbi:MAG: PAS domain S-box protein [Alphaproteobacteria bacterium]